jgi:hypothetical protein
MGKMKKTYILGMVKSPLKVTKGDFNGVADAFTRSINPGPSRSLELDFLRLVYSSKQLRSEGYSVNTYFMVTTELVKKSVKTWMDKYGVDETMVNIVIAPLNNEEVRQLVEEKKRNQKGINTGSKDKKENAKADNGKNILESKLKEYIEKKFCEAQLIQNEKEMPFQINWDYCKLIEV